MEHEYDGIFMFFYLFQNVLFFLECFNVVKISNQLGEN